VDAVGSSPERPAAVGKSEVIRMGKVMKDVGIRAEWGAGRLVNIGY